MKKLLIVLIYSFTCLVTIAQQTAQDRGHMEKERQSIQNEIKETQSAYEKVKGQKKETLGQLNLLQKKIGLQDQYIGNINKELRLITDDIYTSAVEINRLQKQLDTLKAQYARSIVYAYKNRSTYDYLNFIFSAGNFNDALKRIAYLKSYRSYRQQQVVEILQTQQLIAQRKQELMGKKTQKNTALQNQEQQLQTLSEQKKEKDIVVSKLKSQESELSKQIAVRKKRDLQLKNQIAALIRREIETRRREEEERRRKEALANTNANKNNAGANENTAVTGPKTSTTTARNTGTAILLNEKEVALSSSFANNKGKLPWPVDKGYVSIHFGRYTVPGTSLTGDNSGLTIATPSPGAAVKAIFDGQVTAVFNLGDAMAVTIRHGKYLTVYSNLSNASVSKGTAVHTGQAIGISGSDDEGGSGGSLFFQLYIDTKNVNPEPWLIRR